HAFKSIDNDTFLDELNVLLIKDDEKAKKEINSYAWVYQPGLPPEFQPPVSAIFTKIDSIVPQISATKNVAGLNKEVKSTNEKLYFINKLPEDLTTDLMTAIDKEFTFTNSKNAEVQAAWYLLALKTKYNVAYPAIKEFLVNVGRRKFLMPLYKEMVKTPEGKKMAQDIYKNAKPNYHSVSYNSLDPLLI
ncbi:MAG TPA: leukotriene A4 hydrolase C-terminal domain-containing protein, partial [Pelobium sp.]|nr:leukotriene A4 hydrolase C-terminal domain-containing protein [Pelobium sp.]